jgi:DNA-binding NarL/FixJ family response regulator
LCWIAIGHSLIARVVLERQGERVLAVACTSAEAVELVAELRPGVVLVDIALGNECGLDLARLLARDGTADAPLVILISAYSPCDIADLIAASPVAGFLPKSDLSSDAMRQIVASSGRALSAYADVEHARDLLASGRAIGYSKAASPTWRTSSRRSIASPMVAPRS